MSFYENTLVAKQDLPKIELDKIKEKYNDIINSNSGKVLKVEEWGLMNLATKIRKYNKGFYIHYKFEGNKETLSEINKNKQNIDLCNKCMSLRLPEYNMGFNKKGWENFARQKTITDSGSKIK